MNETCYVASIRRHKMLGANQLSENVITFQFFMLWHERTNHKARYLQLIKSMLITCVICTELEKTAAKNELKLRPIFYLHSFYSEGLIITSMSASSDEIITFEGFRRTFTDPQKIIST